MYKNGQVIKNSNGYQYKVIVSIGSYTLLETIDAPSKEYIVAWCLNKYDSGYSWGQGHYFHILDNAKQCFKEKSGFSVEYAQELMNDIFSE